MPTRINYTSGHIEIETGKWAEVDRLICFAIRNLQISGLLDYLLSVLGIFIYHAFTNYTTLHQSYVQLLRGGRQYATL